MPLGGAACGAQPVGIEVDVFLPIPGQPPIEIRGALVARAARSVKLKRLFDFSYNPSLAARELTDEIARGRMEDRAAQNSEIATASAGRAARVRRKSFRAFRAPLQRNRLAVCGRGRGRGRE